MSALFPGSPRPSSGYCSSDDEPTNSSLVATGVPSNRRSDSTSGPSSSSSSGSCPVTPDSASSEISFSTSGLFEDDLGGFDSGFLLAYGCDVSWLRSPTPLLDELGLDIDSGIPDQPPEVVFARSRTSSFQGECASFGVSVSPTNTAVFETGNGDDFTGSDRRSRRRRFPLPVSSRLSGDEEEEEEEAAPDARCQRLPISVVKVADSSSPSNCGSHDNVGMTTTTTATTPLAKAESNKRTICRRRASDDVSDDVTEPRTPRHVLSDHGYSTSASLFSQPPPPPSPTPPPPAKLPRLSPSSAAVEPSSVREASILAALLLTKEPLRANAGSDAIVTLDESRRGHRGTPSVLEGLLLADRRSAAVDVVRTADSVVSVSGWKTPFSGLSGEEGYVLDSDHLLRNKDGFHVGLTSADDDLAWTTSSQVSSLEVDDLFTQHFEPDDLWMHLSDLL